jgi:hypothetical protein
MRWAWHYTDKAEECSTLVEKHKGERDIDMDIDGRVQ